MRLLLGLLMLGMISCTNPTQNPTTQHQPSLSTSSMRTTTTLDSTTTSTLPSSTTTLQATTTSFVSGDINILFVGNSHTSTHDVPGKVETLLESEPNRDVAVQTLNSSFLRSASQNPTVTDAIISGQWDIVVLQGQEISQSHSVAYSQEGAVALAELASSSGTRPLLFSEWPRRNNNETAYIEGIYAEVATKSGAEVIPVGRSWDQFLADQAEYPLWASDGNHSSDAGAFLAAATIAFYIAGPDAELTTEPDLVPLLDAARLTIQNFANN